MADEIRRLIEHHDGHGLNESIVIETDEPSNGGAAHHYLYLIDGREVGRVQFQKGPRLDPTSTPGVTEAAMLVSMIDRLRGFQSGAFSSRENAIIITKLEECLHWTKARADDRARRGVLGKMAR